MAEIKSCCILYSLLFESDNLLNLKTMTNDIISGVVRPRMKHLFFFFFFLNLLFCTLSPFLTQNDKVLGIRMKNKIVSILGTWSVVSTVNGLQGYWSICGIWERFCNIPHQNLSWTSKMSGEYTPAPGCTGKICAHMKNGLDFFSSLQFGHFI